MGHHRAAGGAHEPPSHGAGGDGDVRPSVDGLSMGTADRRIEATPSIIERPGVATFSFRIVGSQGRPLTSFDEVHERRMHLIVVRRDLTGFQHLHPEMDREGTWRTSVSFSAPGAWRVFADHSADGIPATLGIDVLVRGDFDPEAPRGRDASVRVGEDTVRIEQGHGGVVRFAVHRGGEPVSLEPYLGALGHLVILRWGDLSFLHVHPKSDELAFHVTYPAPGTYGLFLQYVVAGEIRTAEFTVKRDL